MQFAFWVSGALWLLIASLFGGCGVTGTKSVDIWGIKWENFAGTDVHAGFNNIDQVDDRRGVDQRNNLRGQ